MSADDLPSLLPSSVLCDLISCNQDFLSIVQQKDNSIAKMHKFIDLLPT